MTPAEMQPLWEQRLNRAVNWSLRHWLVYANVLVLVYAGLPWLSPLAHMAGLPWLGDLIFRVYTTFCHQIPERSFFLNGYQVAFCHRDTAMYTLLLLGGLLFPLLRGHLRPLSLRIGALLLLPMLIDGGTHLIDDLFQLGLRSDNEIWTLNFWLRMLTGLLFALAVILTIYPRLDRDLPKMATA
ncbi:MAG: hypothetical protein OHK0022_46330 [Roseiflexaceae bacterium]